MTALGAVLVGVAAFHTLIVATNRRDHAAGMHVLVWGAALIIAGRTA